jgi:F420H(2)-dependent quinone reductase
MPEPGQTPGSGTRPARAPSADGDCPAAGARSGQPDTPGWYYNLRARPRAEVTYQDRSVAATAREADDAEWQAIWSRARTIYGGYEA